MRLDPSATAIKRVRVPQAPVKEAHAALTRTINAAEAREPLVHAVEERRVLAAERADDDLQRRRARERRRRRLVRALTWTWHESSTTGIGTSIGGGLHGALAPRGRRPSASGQRGGKAQERRRGRRRVSWASASERRRRVRKACCTRLRDELGHDKRCLAAVAARRSRRRCAPLLPFAALTVTTCSSSQVVHGKRLLPKASRPCLEHERASVVDEQVDGERQCSRKINRRARTQSIAAVKWAAVTNRDESQRDTVAAVAVSLTSACTARSRWLTAPVWPPRHAASARVGCERCWRVVRTLRRRLKRECTRSYANELSYVLIALPVSLQLNVTKRR